MQIKFLDFGNSQRFKFNLSALSKETWQGIAEDIVAVTISPRVVWQNTTSVNIVVRDNVAKMKIGYAGQKNYIVATLTLDEFGCAKDDYSGNVSKILQLCMKELYGEDYSSAVKEKQESLSI